MAVDDACEYQPPGNLRAWGAGAGDPGCGVQTRPKVSAGRGGAGAGGSARPVQKRPERTRGVQAVRPAGCKYCQKRPRNASGTLNIRGADGGDALEQPGAGDGGAWAAGTRIFEEAMGEDYPEDQGLSQERIRARGRRGKQGSRVGQFLKTEGTQGERGKARNGGGSERERNTNNYKQRSAHAHFAQLGRTCGARSKSHSKVQPLGIYTDKLGPARHPGKKYRKWQVQPPRSRPSRPDNETAGRRRHAIKDRLTVAHAPLLPGKARALR
ncbi:hypothetical protein C8F04DRAFT_1198561 [Mycena alexandri]|uniref:Uncharacterized protein n=1 Tax=Mycena alexandri TaxID=1745969 RepID=A0AAD6S1H0_9AGAR|nr:hypothetical protein C8F04DRAFT_1198561 [Mycena alexandri]